VSKYLLFFFTLISCFSHADVNLTSLDDEKVLGWEKEIFSGETTYEMSSFNGKKALKASSQRAASGLLLQKRIDLLDTPYLNWSWLITKRLPPLDERSKTGDDYAARVYIVAKSGFLGLDTKALSYVWSSSQEMGNIWNNAYASSNVKMLAVRGKHSKTSQWYSEKRNVYQDLIQYFGDKGSEAANQEAYRYIDVVALMTDTDNGQSTAESYYGDIIFSRQ